MNSCNDCGGNSSGGGGGGGGGCSQNISDLGGNGPVNANDSNGGSNNLDIPSTFDAVGGFSECNTMNPTFSPTFSSTLSPAQ
jgi:hypothetical protein